MARGLEFAYLANNDSGYIDWEFYDFSENSLKRLWQLSYCQAEKSFYGSLRRSIEDDSDFGDDILLPRKIVEFMIEQLPKEHVVAEATHINSPSGLKPI